jgi:hypothetical protein
MTADRVGQAAQGGAAGWGTSGQGGGTSQQPPLSLHAADGTPLLALPAVGTSDAISAGVGGVQGPGLKLSDAAVVVTSIVRPQSEPVIETLLVGDVVQLHAALILAAANDGDK